MMNEEKGRDRRTDPIENIQTDRMTDGWTERKNTDRQID
jgi:hypothetical protein